jgi:hypothetical protein
MSAAVAAPLISTRRRSVAAVVGGAVAVAVLADLALYALGRLLGGSFRFTSPTGPAEVDALTVAGFTVVPLLAGLVLAALLGRLWPPLYAVALVVAPALALGTILVMTLPADLDPVSTAALASCHLVLAAVAVLALRRLRGMRELGTSPLGDGR